MFQFADCITCLPTSHFILVSTDTAFSPVHSLVPLASSMPEHVSFPCFIHHFSIPVCYKRLSRAIHSHNRSHPAGTQFLYCITCLATSHFVLVWAYSCLSANSLVWHIYTFLSLNMSEHVFFLFHIHLPFSIPVCLMARLSRAIHQQIFSCLASKQFADCMTCPTDTHFLLVCTDYHNFDSLLIFLSLNMSVYASFPCLISLHPCVLP